MDHDRTQIVDELAQWLSDGQTLRAFCRQAGKPSKSTIYRWLEGDESLAGRVARARDEGFEAIAEECVAIADDGSNDWMEKLDKEGNAVGWSLNGEHVQRSKLRIETRLKLLACWNPARYSGKPTETEVDPQTFAAAVRSFITAARAQDSAEGSVQQ